MDNFVIILFCLIAILYLYYLYRKRIYVATMFWLGSFFISFLIPNLSGEKFGLGYIPNSKVFLQLNFYYLILLLTFIVANFFVTHLYLKRIKWPYLSLDYKVLNRVNIIYLIFSLPVLLIEKDTLFKGGHPSNSPIEILKSITVFGLILSSLTKILYCKTKKQKIYSTIILVYAVLFGIAVSFARRFIIFPIILHHTSIPTNANRFSAIWQTMHRWCCSMRCVCRNRKCHDFRLPPGQTPLFYPIVSRP